MDSQSYSPRSLQVSVLIIVRLWTMHCFELIVIRKNAMEMVLDKPLWLVDSARAVFMIMVWLLAVQEKNQSEHMLV